MSPRAADSELSTVQRADTALRDAFAALGGEISDIDWSGYDALVAALHGALVSKDGARLSLRNFDYEHPPRLQHPELGIGKAYCVPLAYSDPGGDGEVVIAIGGITNVSQRFDFLALDATPTLRVIGLDLAGRGHSGWLVEQSDYHLDAYIEQLAQFMDFLGLESCTLLGSSLGGSTAICFAARHPQRVRRIMLNDSAPYIPVERRARRAKAVARHYVFRSPAEMFRRTGAATRHSGPAPDAALLHSAHSKTCWSPTEGGRVYRHDLRALLAYRAEAGASLDLWREWSAVQCPVLLIHGMLSDATSDETIERMRSHDGLSVIHVPHAGHTPTLSDGALIQAIVDWAVDDKPFAQDRTCPPAQWPKRVLYPQ